MAAVAPFQLDNSYARDLEGFSVPWRPEAAPAPKSLFFNEPLAQELGLDVGALSGEAGAALFAGNTVPEGAEPIAQAYAGHQFGGFSPQLGDGRAILLGEVIDRAGQRRDIALKGSGRTPFSRGGDGKAAVGPMLREVLIGEAMHALGIPTTRALAVVATGQPVFRETVLPGAVLTRVAASHIRVGTFQFFAARGDVARVRQLAEYTILRHDADLVGSSGRFLGLLERVAERLAMLIAQWMNVGFIHGVMNTDNMTISGETIDYGPCAFVETYDPAAVFSSIDSQGRYAFGNQPGIARWNLARLAEALLPLIADDEDEATAEVMRVLDAFPARYRRHLLSGERAKFGLQRADGADAADAALADDWLAVLHAGHVDFTLAWRRLADAAAGDDAPLRALFPSAGAADGWLERWRERCAREDEGAPSNGGASAGEARAARMRRVNPSVIPRNHRVEEALAAASDDADLGPFDRLLDALRHPYDESADNAGYAEPAPADVTACYRTFCGT
ncbi:MAG: YdiU family protein [Pseudomonadota bacterium]|nr:YdiU family protein [Pseudomonadota bacterium]